MLNTPRLNYDNIAPEYNQRYQVTPRPERASALLNLVNQHKSDRILEVGSGTGFWLNLLSSKVKTAYGLDFSRGMLIQAKGQPEPLLLLQGEAVHLPYQINSFDLIYSVDAIHHFGGSSAFITEAFRILRPGGLLAVIGHDPHNERNRWYVYEYFDGVLSTDLSRYPSESEVTGEMQTTGFENISAEDVEHIQNSYSGQQIFEDPYLKKSSSSQLALLSDEAYQAGLEIIKAAISCEAEIPFRTDLHVRMFTGFKP